MKKNIFFLIYILIYHIPKVSFSQSVNAYGYPTYTGYFNPKSSFSDYNNFKEYKDRWDKYEYENMSVLGDDDDKYVIWGNPTEFLERGVTGKLTQEIALLDKREFKEFAEFITRDLLIAYMQFNHKYSMVGDRLIYASPNLFYNYPNGSQWLQSKSFLEENNIDINKFSVDPSDIKFEFTYGETGRMVAQAHSPLKDDIRIIINIDMWEQLNNYQRIWLIMHEWGHEAFGMKHGDNKIMYPLMPDEELLKKGYTMVEISLDDLRKEIAFRFDNGPYADNPYIDRDRQIERELNRTLPEMYKVDRQKFGDGNYSNISFGDMTTPPIAFNILFDSVLDFFDDLIKNRSFIWKTEGRYDIINENKNDSINEQILKNNKYYIIIDKYRFPDVLGDPKNSQYRDW